MPHIDAYLDARGLNCPLPILRTRKAIAALEAGQVLEVTASDPGAVRDMDSFCKQTGHELLENRSEDGHYAFLIRRG
jgi:tRNA 2-thiouridine synthesizing protein A